MEDVERFGLLVVKDKQQYLENENCYSPYTKYYCRGEGTAASQCENVKLLSGFR